ncbi:ABC transporter ATP-binding protein [Phytohabitans aurantiacus]|uniref:ABC transporter ATP-binding protein n=2 Tax=Phytohabitans aurantiacus TaxID=3016789 RepID=A0ABQ5R6R8_9ACTN|nr:ABC transporter ATP-binding protein [Phytohabitans aurantiacus]GLI02454.1 ABC transporter ATP-binding protein [Phytohabitans aurantiacus]
MSFDVRVARVVKRFPSGAHVLTAIDDLSFDVPAGAAVAITGPSGSGKSTLLHLIGALEPADAGTITVGPLELTTLHRRQLPDYRRRIGFVFQRYHLLSALTVLDNVVAPTLPYRNPRDPTNRARELLDAVGLAGRERALPAELSGGEQQRVAIARALIGDPGLLLADEPTGNLGAATGAQILDLLLQLRRERGMTILLATHEQHIAARCDRLIRLGGGRVVEDLNLTDGEDPALTLRRVGGLRL